jgi:hypothetical protein
LQWQLLRLVERPVQAREPAQVVQLAQVLVQAREPARVLQLAQVLVRVAQRVLAQVRQPALAQQVRAQQPHSPHQQLQSLCQPELCHLH